jgi:chorismate mutase
MSSALVRALRGATTCDEDTPEEIAVMMERNGLLHDDVISVLFTTSTDLTSTFPATTARAIGFGDVPLICASEIAVPGAMAHCIRIMMHVYTTRTRDEIHHIYLRQAQSLRDDLRA